REEARERGVGTARQETAVKEERVRVVERLERPVGSQAALEGAALLEFPQAWHRPYIRARGECRDPDDRQRARLRRCPEHERPLAREAARGARRDRAADRGRP